MAGYYICAGCAHGGRVTCNVSHFRSHASFHWFSSCSYRPYCSRIAISSSSHGGSLVGSMASYRLQGGNSFKYLNTDYLQCNEYLFYRTKIINTLVNSTTTPIVFNWDSDVITTPENIIEAIRLLRSGISFAYPYTNFIRIKNDYYKIKEIIKNDFNFSELIESEMNSKGGAIGFIKSDFISAGMENQNIIDWGFEDVERYSRFCKLGYEVVHVEGNLYHIEHQKVNISHPYITVNKKEYKKVSEMSKDVLLEYIRKWKWKNKI